MIRDQLKKAWQTKKDELSAFNEKFWEMKQEHEKKTIAVNEAALEYCMKAELLKEITWEFRTYYSENTLVAKTNHVRGTPEVNFLFQYDYHCQTMLTHNATIRFDDHETTLRFNDLEQLKAFVSEHNLKVDYSSIEKDLINCNKEIEKQTERLNELKSFIQKVKG